MQKAKLDDDLCILAGSTIIGSINVSIVDISNDDKTRLWHMRLGYMSVWGLEILSNWNLLNSEKINILEFCEYCILQKKKKDNFNTNNHNMEGVLDYIHSTLCGLSKFSSKGVKRYHLTFINDFSQKVWMHLLKENSDAFEEFKEWKILAENQMEWNIKYLYIWQRLRVLQ